MDTLSEQSLMMILALATPLLAALIYFVSRTGEMAEPRPGRLILLALAGPLNFLGWLLLRGRLEDMAMRQAFGLIMAAIMFVVLGFGFGFLRHPDRRSAPHVSPGREKETGRDD